MEISDRDLLSQFSAYVKVAVKHTRGRYLEKYSSIRKNEVPYYEEDMEETGGEDLLEQIDRMSGVLDKGILEMKLLLDQISDSVLFHAVNCLNKQQKEILLLRILYMKSFHEIGQLLGIPAKKAENTYYNAIKKIRKVLGEEKNGI